MRKSSLPRKRSVVRGSSVARVVAVAAGANGEVEEEVVGGEEEVDKRPGRTCTTHSHTSLDASKEPMVRPGA